MLRVSAVLAVLVTLLSKQTRAQGTRREKGSDQLIVTLLTLSIHPFVHNQLIRTLFEARPVVEGVIKF